MKKIDWFILLLITIISVFVLKDLFKPGMYSSHDGIHQVVRFYYFDQVLRDGQIPPRWAQGLMNGFGYPLFIFSYHLPWFMAELIRVLGFSIIDSVKYTFLVGFILSGVVMYLFQKDIFGRLPAIVGTSLYLFAPYRFSNIFVRAAIGDATTFIFAPLLFWSIFRLKNGWDGKWICLGALSTAGLALSHAMVAALFLGVSFIYIGFSLFWLKNKFNYLKSFITLMILGAILPAYYLIPSITERTNTQFQSLMSQIFIGAYFPTINDLIYSRWGYGVFHAREGAMSVQLGLTQWLVVLLTLIVVVVFPLIYKKRSKEEKQLITDGKIILFIFAFTIFMMLPMSLPFWKLVSSSVFVDFPWRFLAVSTFLVSVGSGLLIAILRKFKVGLAIVLLLLAIYANRNHLRINETLSWDLPFMLKLERTTNSYDEYKPKWVKEEFINEKKPRVEFFGKTGEIKIGKDSSNYLEFNIDAAENGIIRINTIYYPGWKVYVNGKLQDINYQSSGLLEFPLASGKSKIVSKFTDTPLRKVSNIITVTSVLILTAGLIKYKTTRYEL